MRTVLLLAAMAILAIPGFEPVQPELFSTGGALTNAWADYDRDGDPDLFVGFNGEPNRLYRNDGGTFTDVAAMAGVADARPTRAAAWGDYDADGDVDLLVGFAPGDEPVLRLYRNVRGRFDDIAREAGLALVSGAVRQPAWVDFDGDADVDLFVAFRDRPNALFRNDGGRFVDIAPRVGLDDARHTVGAVWFDHDEDGDLDVVVGNMDGDRNGLFRNDDGTFTDVADSAGIAWGGRTPGDPGNGTVRPCAADVDGDGHIDLFFANYGRNGLFRNLGNGTFEDVSAAWGIAVDGRYDTCAFADIDHDGRLDLYVNGTITGGVSHPDHLFQGEAGRFVEVTPAALRLEADHGAQWADFDADGDADLALAGAQPEGTHALLRNMLEPAAAARSLQVAVIDAAGRPIRPGAVVRVYAAATRTLLGTGLVDAGSGYNAQSVLPVHIGLSADGEVDVEVVFPLAGTLATTWRYRVDPRTTVGRAIEVRVPER